MLRRLGLAVTPLILSFVPVFGQQPVGTPSFTTAVSHHPIETVNLGNLNVHIQIPLVHKAGRGLPFLADWNYDSSVWQRSISTPYGWLPVTGNGIALGVPMPLSVNRGLPVQRSISSASCPAGGSTSVSTFTYVDPSSTEHTFPVHIDSAGCIYGRSASGSNNEGYFLSVSYVGSTTDFSATVTTPSGTKINGSSASGTIETATDRNGNQISYNPATGMYTDTLGVNEFSVSTSSGSTTYGYKGEAGTFENIVETFTPYYLTSNFGCFLEYVGTFQTNLPTKFALPDGTSYQISWEQTPGYTNTHSTGRISSVTLPTGGKISYAYSGGTNGMGCDASPPTLKITTPDGTWTYVHVPGPANSNTETTTVTDPAGNVRVLSFFGTFSSGPSGYTKYGPTEIQRKVYSGSASLLETDTICYNGQTVNCGTAPDFQKLTATIQHVQTIVQLAGNVNFETDDFFDANQIKIEHDDYDYGTGAVGPLLRKTYFDHGSYNVATDNCSALGNNIVTALCQVHVHDAGGNLLSKTTFTYDEVAPVSSGIGTTQHIGVAGSRGNPTTLRRTVANNPSLVFLTKSLAYYDTGLIQQVTDENQVANSTYTYGGCGNSFLTNINLPDGFSRQMSWNCDGGVLLSSTDENGQAAWTFYNGQFFWRPSSAQDKAGNVTTFSYTPTSVQRSLTLATGSTQIVLSSLDTFGRPSLIQQQQATGTNWDTVETDYNSVGLIKRVTQTFSSAKSVGSSTASATVYTYDGLNRTNTVTASGGATVTLTYNANDVIRTLSPAPSGEATKTWNNEYDSIGRLRSICEVTGNTGDGLCGQAVANYGLWTKYAYGGAPPNVNSLAVTQNAQSSTIQTRTYIYDMQKRVTSETNPESGTTRYFYDSDASCGTSKGDLVKQIDANGTVRCTTFDLSHRLSSVTYPTLGSGVASTLNRYFAYDAGSPPGGALSLSNPKGRLVEAYTASSATSPKNTDVMFSYSSRGEVADEWESTPHSGGYYHVAVTYFPHGVIQSLSIPGVPTISYGLDGVGRIATVSDASGSNLVLSAGYNPAGQLTGVTYGNFDSDTFTYDAANRMQSYAYTVGTSPQTITGSLGWNPNGTLGSLTITDPFNSADAQTCAYGYDPILRLTSVNCTSGTPPSNLWNQNFSYDAFGNITKTVPLNGTGIGFVPTYDPATNRFNSVGGLATSYDNNGNLKFDGTLNYSWDGENRPATLNGFSITIDALGRIVEKNSSGTYTQFVYSTTGQKIAVMNGQTLSRTYIPLPGGAVAKYNTGGFNSIRHADWLGSSRVVTTPSQTVDTDMAYAPFGESYAKVGTYGPDFTGQLQDITGSLYDFLLREQNANQGRWITPDPAGSSAANLQNPQSWNRYEYAGNNPLSIVDLLGLCNSDSSQGPLTCPPPLYGSFEPSGITLTLTHWEPQPNIITLEASAGHGFIAARVIGLLGRIKTAVAGSGHRTQRSVHVAPGSLLPNGDRAAGEIAQEILGLKYQWIWSTSSTIGNVLLGATEVEIAVIAAPAAVGSAPQLAEISEAASSSDMLTVTHFTDLNTAQLIVDSGQLNAGTYVTLPSEVSPGSTASEIEQLLEIGQGKGEAQFLFQTPASNLGFAPNGLATSGNALQWILINPQLLIP